MFKNGVNLCNVSVWIYTSSGRNGVKGHSGAHCTPNSTSRKALRKLTRIIYRPTPAILRVHISTTLKAIVTNKHKKSVGTTPLCTPRRHQFTNYALLHGRCSTDVLNVARICLLCVFLLSQVEPAAGKRIIYSWSTVRIYTRMRSTWNVQSFWVTIRRIFDKQR